MELPNSVFDPQSRSNNPGDTQAQHRDQALVDRKQIDETSRN